VYKKWTPDAIAKGNSVVRKKGKREVGGHEGKRGGADDERGPKTRTELVLTRKLTTSEVGGDGASAGKKNITPKPGIRPGVRETLHIKKILKEKNANRT